MNKSWTNNEQVMNKSLTSYEQVVNKSWTSNEQVILLKLLQFIRFLTIPVDGRTDQLGIIPTQPSLAGVGAGAELGNFDLSYTD